MHLFEFNDHPSVPVAVRKTLLEQLESCNTIFRPYYRQVSEAVLSHASESDAKMIVELGAGTAPLSKLMAEDAGSEGIRLVACDLFPDKAAYRELETRYPDKVTGMEDPVDFGQPRRWPPSTVLVLCAAMHHVPSQLRPAVIEALSASADQVMVFEPVRKTALSMFFVLFGVFPPLLLPLCYLHKPGRLRRLLWCWLLPVVPVMTLWDALVGCLRQWNDHDWQEAFAESSSGQRKPVVNSAVHSQVVTW